VNKLAMVVIALLTIGAYFYRDQLPALTKTTAPQTIYTWKDKNGKVNYSADKATAPAHAKPADLPGLSIIETDRAEMEKQAKRLEEKEKPAESRDDTKPKLPEVRNLALERMEKTINKAKH
jgi:hypothetical protein